MCSTGARCEQSLLTSRVNYVKRDSRKRQYDERTDLKLVELIQSAIGRTSVTFQDLHQIIVKVMLFSFLVRIVVSAEVRYIVICRILCSLTILPSFSSGLFLWSMSV